MRITVQLHPQHAEYSDIRDAVTRAEALGVDTVYNWDHFYPLYGDPEGKHFEAWTMQAAWAEQTSSVDVGCLVTCNSYRNPELLADMARTVDHISGGRLVFGIGSGWFQKDYEEYGYEFGTAGSRLDDLAEALPRIVARWEKLNPAPTRKIPILIGGSGEKKTLKMVAQYADIWHSFIRIGEPEVFEHKKSVLQKWCDEVGRDFNEIDISVGGQGLTPEHGEELVERGIAEITIGLNGPDYDMSEVEAWVAWRDRG
jgi:probable F420-dependent oxidoreductase